jgi:hypothetical protein
MDKPGVGPIGRYADGLSAAQMSARCAISGRRRVLATFRTAEGFTVIKSELVHRISIQNPHLYRKHAEKIVNTIFSVA